MNVRKAACSEPQPCVNVALTGTLERRRKPRELHPRDACRRPARCPRHPRQRLQQCSIDGDQAGQRRFLRWRQDPRCGHGLRRQFGDDRLQHLRIEDSGGFAQRTQSRGLHTAQVLDLLQRRELLNAPQTVDRGIEEIQEQQAGLLVEEQLPIASLVTLGTGRPQPREQIIDQAKILEPLQPHASSQTPAAAIATPFARESLSITTSSPCAKPCRTVLPYSPELRAWRKPTLLNRSPDKFLRSNRKTPPCCGSNWHGDDHDREFSAGRPGSEAGKIAAVPAAWKSRPIDFWQRTACRDHNSLGDVSTAYHSTGIPDIEVYM